MDTKSVEVGGVDYITKPFEEYIENHSEALFSHGLCPGCADKLYADREWYQKTSEIGNVKGS